MLQQFIQRRPGYTIDGQEGTDLYPVPGPEAFITDEGVEQSYVPAEDIRVMAQRLIEAYDQRFYFLQGEGADKPAKFKIAYLWKAKGASSHGQLVLATCQKPGGLLAHFMDYHWVIVVHANHCRDQGLTRLQVEALVFHELKHCGTSPDGAPIMVPHDLEVFADEIEEYGAWRSNIVPVAQAVQKRLPGIVDEGMGLPVGGA